ncbi:hypothetical protein QQ045_005416 [Rhodiola kirilowii]
MNGRKVDVIRHKLGFAHGLVVDIDGKSGGLAIWWREEIQLSVRSYSYNHIDCLIELSEEVSLTVFYGNHVTHRRIETWNLLRNLNQNNNLSWIVLGDFNEACRSFEPN